MESPESHNVSGRKRGKKIFFNCSSCDFRRVHNLETGNITTEPGTKGIPHTGTYKAGKYKIHFEPETKNPDEKGE